MGTESGGGWGWGVAQKGENICYKGVVVRETVTAGVTNLYFT